MGVRTQTLYSRKINKIRSSLISLFTGGGGGVGCHVPLLLPHDLLMNVINRAASGALKISRHLISYDYAKLDVGHATEYARK